MDDRTTDHETPERDVLLLRRAVGLATRGPAVDPNPGSAASSWPPTAR